jgi:hypothetical protein
MNAIALASDHGLCPKGNGDDLEDWSIVDFKVLEEEESDMVIKIFLLEDWKGCEWK